MPDADRVIRAVYHVTCAAEEADAQARGIALEQSVEVPQALVDDDATEPQVRERFVATVADVQPIAGRDDGFVVTVDYPEHLASGQVPQLLNLLYGNISIKNNIRLVDFDVSAPLAEQLGGGPRWGVPGLRELLGVYDRPLLATAIKPRGSSLERLADIAFRFALGGGDLVKDDHNLVDPSLDAFVRRVATCHLAVERANAQTGRRCLYLPNLCAGYGAIEKHLQAVAAAGIRGVLLSPMLVGFDAIRLAARQYDLLVMTHPTFGGTFLHDREHGMTPAMLLGKLTRLAGADASVYPNSGGRFGFTDAECRDLDAALKQPMHGLKPAWPAPAGGMQLANIADMAQQYGQDCICLVGGALLTHDRDLANGTAAFADAVRQRFRERLETPAGDATGVSACEVGGHRDHVVVEHLPFDAWRWGDRPTESYKSSEDGASLPFRHVVRQELLGKAGEPMAFDLRYFEIGPGGFSSLERHRHVHAVIAVRGQGVLISGEQKLTLSPMDIAYIPPMQVHQLRHPGSGDDAEPFGFFCVVDHVRDRPQSP